MTDHSAFFARTWSLLQQSSLFRPGADPTFGNPSFGDAGLRVLIVRLSPYRDVDRSTPHLFLHQAVRRAEPSAYIDMAFLPPRADRDLLRRAGVPFLVGMQSWHDARSFDLVLVSNAYSLELINLPYLLLNSGIPMLSGQRDETWPLILLGGSNSLAAQAIMAPDGDSIVDALFFGEGEREVERLVSALAASRPLPKPERLTQAARVVHGLWRANASEPQSVVKAICTAPSADDLLTDYPLLDSAEAGTARLQISYGCPAFCSFCFEGYDRKPYREIALDAALEAARRLKRASGAEALDLFSFNFNTHTDILALLPALNRLYDRVAFQSQRIDILASVPDLLEAQVAADKRSYTLGIEGISRRMRAFLHKSLTEAEITSVLRRLLRQKIREIKLFYILTGHENELDMAEFREFLHDLKEMRQALNRGVRLVFSFGLLIRMPFTPLRYDALYLDEVAWRPITGSVKSSCETNGFEFRLATSWDEYAVSQVLALGGHWLLEPLVRLASQDHCYDTHLTPGYWEQLHHWMERNGRWTEEFLGAKTQDYVFPLEDVQARVGARFLYAAYLRALQGEDDGYCLGESCRACGGCSTREEREAITQHTFRRPGAGYIHELIAGMRAKWQLKPLYVMLRVPEALVGAEPEWLNARVLRALLRTFPALEENLLSVRECLFTVAQHRNRYAGLHGEMPFALRAWDTAPLLALLSADSDFAEGLRVLELLPAPPQSFTTADLEIRLPVAHFVDIPQRLRAHLQASYVPANLRREGDGYRLDLAPKALKKSMVLEGLCDRLGDDTRLRLRVTPKFDLLAFLRSFPEPERYREVRVAVSNLHLI